MQSSAMDLQRTNFAANNGHLGGRLRRSEGEKNSLYSCYTSPSATPADPESYHPIRLLDTPGKMRESHQQQTRPLYGECNKYRGNLDKRRTEFGS